jgi:hypothetical protein
MYLRDSDGTGKSSIAPYGARNLFGLEPRAYARGYILPPANAGSLTNLLVLALLLVLTTPIYSVAQTQPAHSQSVKSADLDAEVTDFLSQELALHLADIKSYDPPPGKVLGGGATGEYTWGTFMNALGAYAALSQNHRLADRELAREVGRIGLLEYRLGGTRFSQLYAVSALRFFGQNLNSNPVWQGLSEEERQAWRKFLDVSAFYDPKTQRVINLPENYLGVAARIAATSYQLGLLKDRALLESVIERAARPFNKGGIFSDDAPPTGRFDRYSNEYARFVWLTAEATGRQDILDAVRPSLKAQMQLWWHLILPDGYGYAWGRSMGVVSYEDTLEIVGFLARHPEFRPAPLEQLASAYYQAWRWLRHDYNDKTHMLSVFAFGRGNYSYISCDREWQQTTSFFGKTGLAHALLVEALKRENVTEFSPEIVRHDLARFEFFRRGDRPAGVWLVRQGPIYFTLPIATGTKPGVADYLPAPHGLPGFQNPVEQVYPSLVPFLELADGRVLVAGDSADEICPGADGKSLRAIWRRWVVIGGKAGELVDPRITAEVVWSLDGKTLTRDETLKTTEAVTVKRWWVAVPGTASTSQVEFNKGQRWDRMKMGESTLSINATADWPLMNSLKATGDGPLGRGARGPIPLHLIYESHDLQLKPGKPTHWRLILSLE